MDTNNWFSKFRSQKKLFVFLLNSELTANFVIFFSYIFVIIKFVMIYFRNCATQIQVFVETINFSTIKFLKNHTLSIIMSIYFLNNAVINSAISSINNGNSLFAFINRRKI